MRNKLFALSGVFWFLMDIFWFWKLYEICIVFTVATLICVGTSFLIKNMSESSFIASIALISWLVLNICMLSIDMSSNEGWINFMKFIGFGASFTGVQAMIRLAIIDKNFFEKFRRL